MSVGENIPHDSAVGHATGQSSFIDDRPEVQGEVFVGIVTSPVAHGKIKKIDFQEALQHPDVLAIFRGRDFHKNVWGTIVEEQPLLADPIVSYMDEPVLLIAVKDRQSLPAVRRLIKIEMEEIPSIFTIDEAVAAKKFSYVANPFVQGNVIETLQKSPHRLNGVFECGGQEHFYLENQAAIVYPLENGQLEIHSSSQHPTETQHLVAHAVGLRYCDVVSVVKRLGGGFGGKESQAAPFAAYAALVATKLKKPARCVLSKDEDMKITGKRHPFKIHYEVGFDDQGLLIALRAQLYSDGGAYTDLSPSILERAMFHLDGAYHIPNVEIKAACCRTNNHSNTAFRGFGAPQGNMAMESIMEDIAIYLKKDSFDIRRANCYGTHQRNVTPYGQCVENNQLPFLFDELYKISDYEKRSREIQAFNLEYSGKVRGLSMTATKFGIAFTARFLNQANALVNVHVDGTVQVSTGATEMGQGVNTKLAQIVADTFGIPSNMVRVMPTSTEKNHNTSPTAASSGADLNGAAVLEAASRIKQRLQGLDTKLSWTDLVKKAYLERISLGEYAHYKTPGLDFDKNVGKGKAFNYFTMGTAVTEVEVDEYTGESKVLRVDILMDIGRSINPGIDKGQVTGAFAQAMGWVTTEKLVYDQKRHLLSHSPTTYKIPSVQDTPPVLNVAFIENHTNTVNVHASKAVGEPPFVLGLSVWTAIKRAIGVRFSGKIIPLQSPATGEQILGLFKKMSSDSHK
ncbi:MAG: xanthine dehydrogenase molybdopterin binding subunit [Bdellovibrionales bacterium GWA2_49_15]|nr:MAG: xanthine dehydrogenase molybdopterin binding subunit [Bdellovibrionales bacterium GWA2_49_15]HAZ11825.1 xanthine dehydrogenase molybdopterin binding subunit [Bdellovibrionales bacterium]